MKYLTHWRAILAAVLFLWAEFVLFGAAEGVNKWGWIESGTVPITLLTLGFAFLHMKKHGSDA